MIFRALEPLSSG